MPTDTPAPTDTPEPTAQATAEPTPTPDAEAELYSLEEVVSADADAGKWVYKNSTLSIEITRYTDKTEKLDFPYYVADIHMKADELRTGFGQENRSGTTKDSAMNIAKRYKAVLLVTGDNLIHMDREKKGVLIRDGILLNGGNQADEMVWHPEKLALEMIPQAQKATARNLEEAGVENSISFGPTLIKDGEKTEQKTLEKHWLYKTNPRVGVGMVEPGHCIVVVGGYRSDNPRANLGWNLVEFADVMENLGCTQAYNVDGGVSACMVFMGERLNQGGNKKDWSQLRTLPDGIIFGYSELVKE